MKRPLAIAALALSASFPASAAVFYTFSGVLPAYSFTLRQDAFVTSNTVFTPAQLQASSADFSSVEFCLAGTKCSTSPNIPIVNADQLYFRSAATGNMQVGNSFEFQAGTFASFGVNTTRPTYSQGTLTISDTPTASVPEPATWGMFISGFGLVGAAMRRRRISVRFA